MKKLAIFDFDGTLVDSVTDVAACFNQALSFHGFPIHDLPYVKNSIGGNLEQVVANLLPPGDRNSSAIDKVKSTYRQIYLSSEKPNTLPYPGIIDLLKALRQQRVLISINTNKGQLLTDTLAQKLFADFDFDMVVGYDERYPSKPDPYGVRTILERFRITPDEAVYIGDGKSDIDTARAANMDLLLVEWGQATEYDLRSVGPEALVRTPEEIFRKITGIDFPAQTGI